MAYAPLNTMTESEKDEYIELLELENQELRRKTNNRHKLLPIEVRQIRRLAETSDLTHAEIAHEFGVNKATVSRTVNRQYHADVA